MPYLAVKHLHVTTAVLSIVFFMLRAYWSVNGSALLQKRVVKILPHIIDTLLLVCGVYLAAIIGPEQPWILAKVIALIAYIGVGTIAIKRGKTPRTRGYAALVAIAIFLYIVGVALSHNPLSWLATKTL